MAGAKNVIDMRPGKGFTTSQSNEHLRVFSDKDRAKKAQWNYDPSREHLNFEIGKGGVVMKVNKMKSIPQRIAENLEARGIKDPNLSLINQGKRPYFKTVANFILHILQEVLVNLLRFFLLLQIFRHKLGLFFLSLFQLQSSPTLSASGWLS